MQRSPNRPGPAVDGKVSDRRAGVLACAGDDQAPPPDTAGQSGSRVQREGRAGWLDAVLAAAAFAALCVAVLSVAPRTAEPDDGAYRASIVAMTEGHFLTLSNAQALSLAKKLGDNPTVPPNQWVELPDGRFISEKDPGYPFLAAPFEALGIIRWAPLFYGALASVGLFIGARRWVGRFGGALAVGLYCSSGAALAFAWRDYMPTFTDASLVAAGSGILLWAVLATEASPRRRGWVGLVGFVALELASFVRYTDVVILGCAVVTVVAVWIADRVRLPWRLVCWWLASVVVFSVSVAVFDDRVYGGPLTTGYQPGEVTFSLGAAGPNLRMMPRHLLQGLPVMILGFLALVWIAARGLVRWRADGEAGMAARRDLWVGVSLTASWLAMWGLYSTYTWTTDPTSVSVQVVRFYVPATGAICLLSAWLVTRIPGRRPLRAGLTSAVVVAAMFVLGVWSFHAMYAAFGIPLNG
jgi:hypothetical protein